MRALRPRLPSPASSPSCPHASWYQRPRDAAIVLIVIACCIVLFIEGGVSDATRAAILFLSAEARARGVASSCSKIVPLSGTWTMEPPPLNHTMAALYVPHACAIAPLPAPGSASRSLLHCLAGRHITVLGNSVARGFAFELPVLTGTESSTLQRNEQKQRCPKRGMAGCQMPLPDGISVNFHWFLYFDNPHLTTPGVTEDSFPPAKWELDSCDTRPTLECLVALGIGPESEPTDVLLLNFGIAYALWAPRNISTADLPEWWRSQARRFASTLVSAGFVGTVVYVPQTPVRHSRDDLRVMDERISLFNAEVLPMLVAEMDWIVLDISSVARPVVNSGLYEDDAHIPGRLSQIVWHLIVPALCPHGRQM